MISPSYVQKMARYNRWQNSSLYEAADTLSEDARRADRGAFFKSIHATFNHILWADAMWMSRLAGEPEPPGRLPESTRYFDLWEALKRERAYCDERIVVWANRLEAAALAGDLTWRPSTTVGDVVVTRPRWLVVTHMFNHQTHHRGQAHAMLTAAGAKPQDTDLIMMQN